MAELLELLDEMAEALQPLAAELPGLQVSPYWNVNPQPPAIDIYPDDPCQTGAAFPTSSVQMALVVRARIAVNDDQASQVLLLRMLDPTDKLSVLVALQDVAAPVGDQASGFQTFEDGRLLGATWRVSAFL